MPQRDYTRRETENPCLDLASEAHASTFGGESGTLPSICVVETVADALETDPTELGPLYEAVDPDALDRLFEAPHRFASGRVTFRFEGCNVTVDADGWVVVSPGTDGRE